MNKGTKYALFFIIIAIMALAIYVGIQGTNKVNENVAVSSASTQANQNNVANETQNVVTNVTNIENNVTNTPENIVSSTTLSDEEKAKELAKQKWGGDEGVYFAIDTMNSDETYVVSVRDSATTKVLEWYTINTKTGSVKN